jgi:hypothetical protein
MLSCFKKPVGDRLENDESYFNNQLTKIHIKSEHSFGVIMAGFQAFNEFVFWSKMVMVGWASRLIIPAAIWLISSENGSTHATQECVEKIQLNYEYREWVQILT